MTSKLPSQLGALALFELNEEAKTKPEAEGGDWWHQVRINGTVGYGGRCITYAADWAWLMERRMASEPDKDFGEIAKETEKECDYDGLTGFMYGAAVQELSTYWKHGDQLRIWHNRNYGVPSDTEGVVNPAIITMGTTE
jgi:hypothetical protein